MIDRKRVTLTHCGRIRRHPCRSRGRLVRLAAGRDAPRCPVRMLCKVVGESLVPTGPMTSIGLVRPPHVSVSLLVSQRSGKSADVVRVKMSQKNRGEVAAFDSGLRKPLHDAAAGIEQKKPPRRPGPVSTHSCDPAARPGPGGRAPESRASAEKRER